MAARPPVTLVMAAEPLVLTAEQRSIRLRSSRGIASSSDWFSQQCCGLRESTSTAVLADLGSLGLSP